MTRKHPNVRVKLLRLLRPWHRRLGIFSAVFLLLVSISGIVINHSNDLAIDSKHVRQSWLLDFYGIKPAHNIQVYQTQPEVIAVAANQLWLNQVHVLDNRLPLISVARLSQFIVAASIDSLSIIAPSGEIMETQDASTGLPQHIQALGVQSNRLWLRTEQGIFVADADLIEWHTAAPTSTVNWVQPMAQEHITKAQLANIQLSSRSIHLTWERVVLDLHSGRIFGVNGSLMMDGVAVLLILISLSGLLIWWQQKPAKHQK